MPIYENLDFNLLDQINTLAARWLVWNSKEQKKPLGIKKFTRKNSTHMWLLYIMNSVSIVTGYPDFYLDCSWIDYLYIRFIRKMRHVRKVNKSINIFLIEPEIFTKEVCEKFDYDKSIVGYIYDQYWR